MRQTKETMFANKLVALIDRYEKNNSIAGRDVYDIHHFFIQGFSYNKKVILERTGKAPNIFLKELIRFIKNGVTEKIIEQDLNILLPIENFRRIRNVLKNETTAFLQDELNRIDNQQ